VSRITVRNTDDAVWVKTVRNVAVSSFTTLWVCKEAENKGAARCRRELSCRRCKAVLGLQHEIDGVPTSVDAGEDRPYKLFYNYKGNFRLRLVDVAAWEAVAASIPGVPAHPPKTNVENAYVIYRASVERGLIPSGRHPVADVNDLFNGRGHHAAAFRSMRAGEPCASVGLHAKDPLSPATAAEHVTGGSGQGFASSWISATREVCIALLYALPRATMTGISVTAAEMLDTPVVTQLPDDSPPLARVLFHRSREVLLHQHVEAAACETIHFTLVSATRLRSFPDTDGWPEDVAKLAPSSDVLDGLRTDWNCTLATMPDGRRFIWIPGAPNAVREAANGSTMVDWTSAVRMQLHAVCDALAGTHALALYDLEYEVWQERRLDSAGLPPRVTIPALLLQRLEADVATIRALASIHKIKKMRK
jgi:hypothetical protein